VLSFSLVHHVLSSSKSDGIIAAPVIDRLEPLASVGLHFSLEKCCRNQCQSNADDYLDLGSVMASSTQSSPLKSWFVFLHRVAGKPLRPSDEASLAPSLLLERLGLGGFAGKTCVELSTLPRGVRVGLE